MSTTTDYDSDTSSTSEGSSNPRSKQPYKYKSYLPSKANDIFKKTYKSALKYYNDEGIAHAVAWSAVKRQYRQMKNGKWVKK
jgi:cation transport regulator ChaB